jgi:AcrR family transcriptional regulator
MSPAGRTEPGRGRPRSQKARDAILDAASELVLARGVPAVSMDEVAERAGASKATIYRWWPTKQALVLDALSREWDRARKSPHDTGSLRTDLLSLLQPWVGYIDTRPCGRVVSALIKEAQTDPAFGRQYRERFLTPRRDSARTLFTRAIERGEITPDTRVDLALDLIYGPLFHRMLNGHARITDRFVRDVVDAALAGSGAARE